MDVILHKSESLDEFCREINSGPCGNTSKLVALPS